ncbi:TlpA family protein disulfide reductase [Lutibacter sp. HS1-25]|uniref:TlpA family protein disulfide reductase n=1 Tax=Lutibacter sp. HS1-25 TaxID=2485000 RepID=UPI0010124B51|nr:TlpA disulfide reductase family protein [Lutibacter sp. HS1-25]RXP46574.1 TlpA family protein disulfide reductase [Lutibacter sp. HS1-25]
MKLHKIILTILTTVLLVSFTKGQGLKTSYSVITGVLDIPGKTEIKLFKVEQGRHFEVGTSVLNENNEFGFAVSPDKEGFYILGDRVIELPLYLKGGQIFDVKFSINGYELDAPDEENKVLYNWVKAKEPLIVFKYDYPGTPKTYEDFFPFFEKFMPEMKKKHELVNTSNQNFNKLMHAYIDLDIENIAITFVFTPRTKHPKAEDFPSFYNDFMKGENFKSTIVLDLPNGISALRLHQQFKTMHTGVSVKNKDYMAEMFNSIENDTLRGHMALEYNKRYKSYDDQYLRFIEPLRKDIALSEYVSTEIDNYEVGIKNFNPGTQGYPFSYKDQNDKEVSFSDFKGKYVYIDVWAMWCAPCKQEIPYIKQLEKDLHGKNIQFVSISLDKPKEHEKWKKFIKDQELSGIQLFSDNAFDSRIARDYKINAIPRFLLFDPEGKIIDAEAKRPSDPRLREQLEALLK